MDDAFALLLAASAPRPDAETISRRTQALRDPAAFLALVRRHRVAGLVQRGFAAAGVSPPAAIRAALAADARAVAHTGLAMAAETVRLVRVLDAAAVPVLVLKGAPLAMLAHGTLAVKAAWDIDLLVPIDRIDAAATALHAAGYAAELPQPGTVDLPDWHRFAKDSQWRRGAGGVALELHTDLTESPRFLLPGIAARAPAQQVPLGTGPAVPTLAPDLLFAYLCVHGALSGWRRLKWLADLAALLDRTPPAERLAWYRRARALGAGRALEQALLLSARAFGTPLDPSEPPASWQARLTAGWAWRLLSDPAGFDDAGETRLGTVPIHLLTASLVGGLAYKREEVRRRLRRDPRGGRWPYTIERLVRRLASRAD